MADLVPIAALTRRTDRFACAAYRAEISAATCVARQDAAARQLTAGPRDRPTGDYGACRGCLEGPVVQRLTSGRVARALAVPDLIAPSPRQVAAPASPPPAPEPTVTATDPFLIQDDADDHDDDATDEREPDDEEPEDESAEESEADDDAPEPPSPAARARPAAAKTCAASRCKRPVAARPPSRPELAPFCTKHRRAQLWALKAKARPARPTPVAAKPSPPPPRVAAPATAPTLVIPVTRELLDALDAYAAALTAARFGIVVTREQAILDLLIEHARKHRREGGEARR